MLSMHRADDLAAKIVSEALSVDPAELASTSEIYDFPTWDSLGQLKIVLALEERFDCSIENEALFEKLTKYAYIRQFVDEKLREKRCDSSL
jgi:acyl carrier protein